MPGARLRRRGHPGPRVSTGPVSAAFTAVAVAAAIALGATACSSSGASSGSGSGAHLALVAYSTPEPAFKKIIAAYQKTPQGKGVTFTQSFGPSGSQASAVVSGQPGDVVNFSTEPDMSKLVKAGLVASSWDQGPTKGMVTNSTVVFVVRKGNPKGIHSWADLVKPGVKVITPNPFSSGSARWNVMAAYGAALHQGDTPAQAQAYLSTFFKHVAVQDSSASTALNTFTGGEGDVLLDYEDDAIQAQKAGKPIDYVVPQQTILIQNPIAVVSGAQDKTAAQAFVNYLESPAGQKLWGELGYRPVLPSVASQFHFPQPPQLFTIAALGGWTSVTKKFFDPNSGVVTKIEQGLGVSTSKS
jgi:sulfate/thiosulfate transport system substrate-binding protein